MSEARLRKQWDHTSTILALIYNMNRDPRRSQARAPADFHPYVQRAPRGIPITPKTLHMMRGLFTKASKPARIIRAAPRPSG